MLEPVVVHEYCGYCVNATTRLGRSRANCSKVCSVKGAAYLKAMYHLCGAVSGEVWSNFLTRSSA
jgi:hypothetical protein